VYMAVPGQYHGRYPSVHWGSLGQMVAWQLPGSSAQPHQYKALILAEAVQFSVGRSPVAEEDSSLQVLVAGNHMVGEHCAKSGDRPSLLTQLC